MTRRGDIVAALVLFAVFAAYGLGARQIDVFPGQELEPFKPRTLPITLSLLGMLFCALRIVGALRRPQSEGPPWRSFEWGRTGLLLLAMAGYGLSMTSLGFIVATSLFLIAGILVLGERRPLFAVVLPVVFTMAFYTLMTRLLGLYLAPAPWIGG